MPHKCEPVSPKPKKPKSRLHPSYIPTVLTPLKTKHFIFTIHLTQPPFLYVCFSCCHENRSVLVVCSRPREAGTASLFMIVPAHAWLQANAVPVGLASPAPLPSMPRNLYRNPRLASRSHASPTRGAIGHGRLFFAGRANSL